jgi:hypothetical protein
MLEALDFFFVLGGGWIQTLNLKICNRGVYNNNATAAGDISSSAVVNLTFFTKQTLT